MRNVMLSGIVGSTAYGLAHEGSDKDYLGVFAAPTSAVLGLNPPKDSVVTKDPDTTYHEAKKFVSLALGGNPTVSELLWLTEWEHYTRHGLDLVNIRTAFLSAPRVRDAYMGYASQQFQRLLNREDGSFSADTRKRTEKHARHMVRLMEQGFELWSTGHLTIRLADPERIREQGVQIAEDPERAQKIMQKYEDLFDGSPSALPREPDRATVQDWLIEVRSAYWFAS